MNDTIRDLERDIEETRARLDHTIVRLQDRLTVSGVMDDMLGTARTQAGLSAHYDNALAVIRRNPVPIILIAAGVGLLLTRLAKSTAQTRTVRTRTRSRAYMGPTRTATAAPVVDDVPVLHPGEARVYDPDLSPRVHATGRDPLETRRELNATA